MDEFELKRILYDYIKEISHYSQMQIFATSTYQRKYFQLEIDDTIDGLINFIQSYRDEAVYSEHLYAMQAQSEQTSQLEQTAQVEYMPPGNKYVSTPETTRLREITLSELTESDGSNGKPAYVSVEGKVYDVTMAIRWAGGTHFGLYAGKDLTSEFMICHNGMIEILKILPQIGILKV